MAKGYSDVLKPKQKQRFMTGARAFMLMFVLGPAIGIIGSFAYETFWGPSSIGWPEFWANPLRYLNEWFSAHSFVVIIGGIMIVSGVLFGIRYAGGIAITMDTLGTWGAITGVFFFLISFFMLTRLNDHDLKWALTHPLDSFVIGTVLFAFGFGGLLWFLIRLTGPQRPNVGRDPMFYLIFFLFFMGIIFTGFLSGTFASAAIELAQEINPIVTLPDDPSNPLLAIITFLFSPLAGIYTIGFFIPLMVFPLMLFVITDVRGTGTVKQATEKAAKSQYFNIATGEASRHRRNARISRRQKMLTRKGGRK